MIFDADRRRGAGTVALLEEDHDGDLRVVERREAGEPAVLLVAAVGRCLAELGRTGLAGDRDVAAPPPVMAAPSATAWRMASRMMAMLRGSMLRLRFTVWRRSG